MTLKELLQKYAKSGKGEAQHGDGGCETNPSTETSEKAPAPATAQSVLSIFSDAAVVGVKENPNGANLDG